MWVVRMIVPRELDPAATPAHEGRAYADARPALPPNQSHPGAVGPAGHPLVRARLYRRARPRMASHSSRRVGRKLLGRREAPDGRQHRRPARLLRLWRHHRRTARQRPLLRPGLLCEPSARHFQGLGRRHGLPRRADRRADRRASVRPPLSGARHDGAGPLLARSPDRPVPRPHRQFHQAGALGPSDRRALGGDLPRHRTAFPVIRARSTKRCWKASSPLSSCS